MTNEKRNAAITAKIERYTQHHTATPELAQEAIERIAITNDKSAVDALMKIQVITSKHSGWIEQKLETRWETVKQIHAIASDGIAKALRQPTQSDSEAAAAIRAALYKACPDMPNYPAGIVEPILAAFRQPIQSDALRDALVEASERLKQDLLNRAEWDDDVKVVCAGAGAWSRFTTALAALKEQSK